MYLKQSFFTDEFSHHKKRGGCERTTSIKIMKYRSSSLQALKFFHFEFINQLSMFSMFYICEGGVSVWLQVNRLSYVHMFVVCLHLMPFNSLCPWITHASYGASKTPTKLQILVFFSTPPSLLLIVNLKPIDVETLNVSPNNNPLETLSKGKHKASNNVVLDVNSRWMHWAKEEKTKVRVGGESCVLGTLGYKVLLIITHMWGREYGQV
jgi:hypothetical protein